MNLPLSTQSFASLAIERMFYCLAEGTALAAVVALVLQLVPQKNSRTRFAVWFATLAAVVILPVIQVGVEMTKAAAAGYGASRSPHAILTLSSTVAEYIILGWAVLAGLGLLRIALGLWQVRRLRHGCVAMDPSVLGPELQGVIEKLRENRPVSILVSPRLNVPTAIGFLRPAIVVPKWLAHDSQSQELKYVLLHEVAHLQRWDDWTNLAQKLVKATLFFHPGVWWIERKLSLDREMACDDAVLARSGSPRAYAQCLAHVAEKSFLRRQMALAQAAVDRMRQLSLRVAGILDEDRPRSTKLWKPALPMVAAIAVVCAISTANTPDLVNVRDSEPAMAAGALRPAATRVAAVVSRGAETMASKNLPSMVKMASFTAGASQTRPKIQPAQVNARYQHRPQMQADFRQFRNVKPPIDEAFLGTGFEGFGNAGSTASTPPGLLTQDLRQEGRGQTQEYGIVVVVMTSQRISSAGSISWQVNMWELRLPAPAHPPKLVPNKT